MITTEQIQNIIKSKFKGKHFEEGLLFLGIGVISAVICSSYAKLFTFVEHISVDIFSNHPLLIFFLSPVIMVLSFLAVWYFAPGSSGSGIPQVLVSIETPNRTLSNYFLRKSVIIVKIVSSLFAAFAGAAIGREGPSLQISGAIAWNIGKLGEKFGVRIRTEQILVAGAASGLAAAFNTPIGGIVYAIEELSKEHIRTFRDVLLLSVVIAGLTAQLISGNYLYLGYPLLPKESTMWSLALVGLTALLAGILGGLFSKLLIRLLKWRSTKTFTKQILIAMFVGLLFACAFYFLGPRVLYSGKESINAVLFTPDILPWYEAPLRMLMPAISSMTGIAGGIFAPSLSAGAVFGNVVSYLLDPDLRNILALSGMVGFLTGVTHTPITSFLLVLEMTDRHSAVFPMMLAALASSIGGHLVSHQSFYEESVEQIKASVK